VTYHRRNWLKIRPGDILVETYDNGSTTYLVLKTDITVPLIKNSLTESLGFKALILHDDDDTAYPWDELADTVGATLAISYHGIHQNRDSVRWKKEFETDD
jgi:hypothetical protein